jgi:hypothetical protein
MWAVFAFLCLGSALIGQEQFRAGRALEDFDIRADKINPAAQFFSTPEVHNTKSAACRTGRYQVAEPLM